MSSVHKQIIEYHYVIIYHGESIIVTLLLNVFNFYVLEEDHNLKEDILDKIQQQELFQLHIEIYQKQYVMMVLMIIQLELFVENFMKVQISLNGLAARLVIIKTFG